MPISYVIDRSQLRLFATAEGVVTYPEIVAHLEKERAEGGLPIHEIIDAAQATVKLSAAEVRFIVNRLRELGEQNALGPTAVVVGDNFSYGVMRMLESLVEDVCDVRPFRSREDAIAWLETIPTSRPPVRGIDAQ